MAGKKHDYSKYDPKITWWDLSGEKSVEYNLSDLEDEDGIITGFGLALDWVAPTPDILDVYPDYPDMRRFLGPNT